MTYTLDEVKLAAALLDVFKAYVGTPTEKLLEDGGWVIDELKNEGYGYINFDAISKQTWEKAWEIFDENVKDIPKKTHDSWGNPYPNIED